MNSEKKVDVLAVMDEAERILTREHCDLAAMRLIEARAAVAELVEAAKGMRAVTGGGNVCTVTESLAAYHRLDAALAKFGGGL